MTMKRLYHGLPASSTPHRPVDSHPHPPLSSLSNGSFGDRENEFSYTMDIRLGPRGLQQLLLGDQSAGVRHQIGQANALGGKSMRSSSAVSRWRQRHWLTGSSRKGGNSCMSASFKAGMACCAADGQAGVGHPSVLGCLAVVMRFSQAGRAWSGRAGAVAPPCRARPGGLSGLLVC